MQIKTKKKQKIHELEQTSQIFKYAIFAQIKCKQWKSYIWTNLFFFVQCFSVKMPQYTADWKWGKEREYERENFFAEPNQKSGFKLKQSKPRVSLPFFPSFFLTSATG